METVGGQLGVGADQLEFEGRGYVQSDDVVNAGFTQGQTSHVVVQVVYDEVAQRDDYDGVNITPLTRELAPKNAFGLNMMRITVDGEPLDDPGRSSEDIQRCTDVALEKANIQFGFDDLEADRRLAVGARPARIALRAGEEGLISEPVRFTMYANYSHFIDRAELRIFEASQSLEATPLAVVPLGPDGSAEWQPSVGSFVAPTRELKYVLRAYGAGEAFDETVPQPLWLVYADAHGAAPDSTATPDTAAPPGAAGADGEVAPELLWERTPSVAPATGDGAAPSDAAGSGTPQTRHITWFSMSGRLARGHAAAAGMAPSVNSTSATASARLTCAP